MKIRWVGFELLHVGFTNRRPERMKGNLCFKYGKNWKELNNFIFFHFQMWCMHIPHAILLFPNVMHAHITCHSIVSKCDACTYHMSFYCFQMWCMYTPHVILVFPNVIHAHITCHSVVSKCDACTYHMSFCCFHMWCMNILHVVLLFSNFSAHAG